MSRAGGSPRRLRVFSDLEALSQAAAALFVEQAGAALAGRGRVSVALSGGSTPQRTYELLSQAPHRERVEWPRVHIFWGDERCVPPDDPRSNARLARQALLARVPVPEEQVHPILCSGRADRAAQTYEELLRRFFGQDERTFDLVLLGLGADGHTASLFPGTAALTEPKRWVTAVFDAPDHLERVTLTPAVLNRSALVAFLVSGADKARALRDVWQGRGDSLRLPARLVHPERGELVWLADRAAAAGVPDGAAAFQM